MKKFLAFLVTLSVVTGLIAGCSSGSKEPAKDPAKETPAATETPAPKQVTLQFWTISLKPTFDDYINGVIKAYEAKNSNVKVVWTDLPFGSIQDKLLSAIAADESPDVVNLNTDMALLMASKGGLTNVDEFATAEQRGVYFEKLYQSAQFQGKTYALPWYAAGHVMFINKEILTEAGLDASKAPQTWDELAQYAKQIKEKTGLDAFIPEGNMNRLFQDGVPILSPDKTKAAFNTPEAVAAVKWYADLFQSGTVSKDYLTKSYAEALNQYMGGQMAFVLTGPQFLKRVQEQSGDVYKVTDVAPYPMGKQRVDQVPLMNVVVPKLAKNKKEAVDFGLFLTNDDNQLAFSKIVSILPSTKKAAADDFFKAKGSTLEDKAKEITVKQLEHGFDLALGIGPKQSEVSKAISDAFQAAANGQATPEAALAEAEKKVNEILARP